MIGSSKHNMDPSFDDDEDDDVDIFMSLMGIERDDDGNAMHSNDSASCSDDNDSQYLLPLQIEVAGKKVVSKNAKAKVARKFIYHGVALPTGNDAASRYQRRRIRNKLSAKVHRQRKQDTLDAVKQDVQKRNARISELRKKVQQMQNETSKLESVVSTIRNNVDLESFDTIIKHCVNQQYNNSSSEGANGGNPVPLPNGLRSHIIPNSPPPAKSRTLTDDSLDASSCVVGIGGNAATNTRNYRGTNTVVSAITTGRLQNTHNPPKKSTFNFGKGGIV